VKEVYLYGSFVKGEIHEDSDIDLIIVGDFKELFWENRQDSWSYWTAGRTGGVYCGGI